MERKQILGISFIVVAFFIFFANSDFSELFTGKVTSNIANCFDSDDGVVNDVKGYVKGSFTPDTPRNDFCIDANMLGEYYCDKSQSDGQVKETPCKNGCKEGVCLDETKGVVCSQGCPYNGECLPVGSRVNGRYCDYTQALKVQKEGECEDSYECKSNLCISGSCLSEEGGKNFLKDVEKTYFWE